MAGSTDRRLAVLALTAALGLLAPALPTWAHPGGLDADGCHHDPKRGEYHCHRGEFAGRSFRSKNEMLEHRAGKPRTVPASPAPAARSFEVRVVRIVDGDTIRVCCIAGREEPVRYIGMDTPETKHPKRGEEPGGREATEINRQLVEDRTVRLELDVQEPDRFGRVLAYVWVERDGEEVMVNAELLRLGYAQVMTIPPNVRYAEWFLKLQREAREAGRGLWGDACAGPSLRPDFRAR